MSAELIDLAAKRQTLTTQQVCCVCGRTVCWGDCPVDIRDNPDSTTAGDG